jgi:capsular polysaccharide biosynthesis protein
MPVPAWFPPDTVNESSRTVAGALANVRRLGPVQPEGGDLASQLRRAWIGRIYTGFLKQFSITRKMFQWIWRSGVPIQVYYLALRYLALRYLALRWRCFVGYSDFTKKSAAQTYKLADSCIVEAPAPRVFPPDDQAYIVYPHDSYVFPEVSVSIVHQAMVHGGTNLILEENEVICHDLYDFKRDYTSEELHGRALIDPKGKRIKWLLHDKAPESIPSAASFVDACAPNYAHWMTEVLPRICLFCANKRFRNVPIIVNDGMHQNIMESLLMTAGQDREIIALPVGRALLVDRLYLTSPTGYVPFERRTNRLRGHSHGVFSRNAFETLRLRLNAATKNIPARDWPEKIYLRRNSKTRVIANAEDVEQMVITHGYTVVDPETLSFAQQVRLFMKAKAVVASSGAALANILFCPPDTRIYILIAKFPGTSYGYWQNMACASGKTVNYILGNIVKGQTRGIHADFRIDMDSLSMALDFSA